MTRKGRKDTMESGNVLICDLDGVIQVVTLWKFTEQFFCAFFNMSVILQFKRFNFGGQVWWHMHVIPATWEVKKGG
jgi:hypothetical protein